MKLTFVKPILFLFAVTFFMNSCSVATEKVSVDAANQTFTFEDIYEGGNTATVEFNTKDLLASNVEITKENMEDVSFSTITLTKIDSIGFSQIKGVKFQIMCDDLPMIMIGTLNEVGEDAKTLNLDILDDVEIEEYMGKEKVYLVMDVDYKVDNENSQNIDAGIKFDIEVEKQ